MEKVLKESFHSGINQKYNKSIVVGTEKCLHFGVCPKLTTIRLIITEKINGFTCNSYRYKNLSKCS